MDTGNREGMQGSKGKLNIHYVIRKFKYCKAIQIISSVGIGCNL